MDRSFSRGPQEPDAGENLAFDFSDEGAADEKNFGESDHAPTDDWQVGDTPDDLDERPEPRIDQPTEESAEEPVKRKIASRPDPPTAPYEPISEPWVDTPPPAAAFGAESRGPAADRNRGADRLSDDVAFFEAPGNLHTSGWFLALFFALAVGFGILSVLICGAPIASARLLGQVPGLSDHFSRPIVPATLVALHEVHASYQTIKGGEPALVVSGVAQNVGNDPLHAVQIAVDLLDSEQQRVTGQATYCGNGLSAKMVSEMTPREIEFLQRLDPEKSFSIAPSQSAPFLMVFVNPPAKIANFRISVPRADRAATAPQAPNPS